MKLLTSNNKLDKQVNGFALRGLQLSPANESGIINTCKHATKGCSAVCIFRSGRGNMSNVLRARIARTALFAQHKESFMFQLCEEIRDELRKANKKGVKLAIRLNVFSDIRWENIIVGEGKNVFETFPDLIFYDYTKDHVKMQKYLAGNLPDNYSLTFSRAETVANQKWSDTFLKNGGNVACVFRGKLPKEWRGITVIDGDKDDARFLDPKGCVVGLLAKGKGRRDDSGFVIDL